MDIYRNEYFRLFINELVNDSNVLIAVDKPGYNIKEFTSITELIPRLKLTNYGNLMKAINTLDGTEKLIGVYKPKIEIEISKDGLEAYVKLNLTLNEYDDVKKDIVGEIISTLKENGITEGIDKELFLKDLPLNTRVLIARGVAPIEGKDAVIKLYNFSEKKPIIKTDGSVNHYELNLIDNVSKGEWLGEKVFATQGTPGISVIGETIPAKAGADKPLRFDAKSVDKQIEEDKEVLYAKNDGAVKYIDGKIFVDNHLVIRGDVGYSTGNINFDGYVTVEGVVNDGFSVTASEDITIQGEMGIGAIGQIISKNGSIFIKGGVNGKNVAVIKAAKNLYLKYVKEADIQAGNSINIGFYAIDSIMTSGKIFVSNDGKIIGGEVHAEHQIVAGTIGNKSERKTLINVKGFERGNIKSQLEAVLIEYKGLLSKGNKVKRQLEIFEQNLEQLDEVGYKAYRGLTINYDQILADIMRLNEKVEKLQEILKTRGDGEVQITKTAFPRTLLEIKNLQKRVKDTLSGTFYAEGRELHFDDK